MKKFKAFFYVLKTKMSINNNGKKMMISIFSQTIVLYKCYTKDYTLNKKF